MEAVSERCVPSSAVCFFQERLERENKLALTSWSGLIVVNHVLVSFPDVVINTLTKTTQGESGLLGPTRATHSMTKGQARQSSRRLRSHCTLRKRTGSGQGCNTQEPPSVAHFLQRGSHLLKVLHSSQATPLARERLFKSLSL